MVNCVVIDDDKDIVKVFSELLELMGLEVLAQGHNGNDAVKMYEKYRPDLEKMIASFQKDGSMQDVKEEKK